MKIFYVHVYIQTIHTLLLQKAQQNRIKKFNLRQKKNKKKIATQTHRNLLSILNSDTETNHSACIQAYTCTFLSKRLSRIE